MKKQILSFISAAVVAFTGISSNLAIPFITKAESEYDNINESELCYNNEWAYIKYRDHIKLYSYYDFKEELFLPEMIDNLPVTELRNEISVYDPNGMVLSVHIPATITDLGSLLGDLPCLEVVKISEDNKSFITENNAVYTSDKTKLIRCLTTAEGEFTIPDTVTCVESNAFTNCKNLKKICIPSSVNEMKDTILKGCNSLENIEVDENNAVYSSSEGVLFDKAKEKLFRFPASSKNNAYSIPDSVKEIRDSAFDNALSLESTDIPNSVEIIGESAFMKCSKLDNLIIPDSIIEVGKGAFKECSSLSKITFSAKTYKFGCNSLEDTPWYKSQPDGAVYTGSIMYALKGSLPENTKLVVKDGTVGINDNAFSVLLDNMRIGEQNLVSVVLPDGIRYIGEFAFNGCENLAEINLPDSIEYIGQYAFDDCFKLKEVHIPNAMETIESGTFMSCYSLEEIVIPSNIKKLDKGSLAICQMLRSITIENPHCVIDDPLYITSFSQVVDLPCTTFYGYSGSSIQRYAEQIGSKFVPLEEKYKTDPENTETSKAWKWTKYKDHVCLDANYSDDEVLELPAEIDELPVTEISPYIYIKNADKITSVKIPASITQIGNLFYQLNNISEIEIDKNNKAYIVEDNTVYTSNRKQLLRCSTDKVKGEFTIPDTVINVNDGAFYNCSELKILNIPKSLISLDCFFEGCSSLESINVAIENNNYSSKSGILFNKYGDSILRYPPHHSGQKYKIPNKVYKIETRAFMDCDELECVEFPGELMEILYEAFKGCDKLDNVIIPDNVLKISDSVFENCLNLKTINFSNKVIKFGKNVIKGTPWLESQDNGPVYCGSVFCQIKGSSPDLTEITVKEGTNCIADFAFSIEKNENGVVKRENTVLKTVVLPDTVKYIGFSAFFGCSALTSASIPEGTKKYTGSTFCGCSSLKDIIISDSTISALEYKNCSSLTDIVIPESISSINVGAFAGCSSLSSITILDPKCTISSDQYTICNSYGSDENVTAIEYNGTICGYDGSTAEKYAKACGYKFVSLGKAPKNFTCGDINDNGIIDAVDASMALSYYAMISTNVDGSFNAGQKFAADVNKDNIIDAVDASKILSYYAYSSTVKERAVPLREFLTGVKVFKGFDVDGTITGIFPGTDNTIVVQCITKFSKNCYIFDPISDKIVRTIKITDLYQELRGMFADGTIVTSAAIDQVGNEKITLYPADGSEPIKIDEVKSGFSGIRLDMENNCIYWIDDSEKCIMKLNKNGEVSKHLSLETYSKYYFDQDNGKFLIAREASQENLSGIKTDIISPSDGKEILDLPYSFDNILLTKENFVFNNNDWDSNDIILQTGSIDGKSVEKAYRFEFDSNELLRFKSNSQSEYLMLIRSDWSAVKGITLVDVKNGVSANADIDISGEVYYNNCYYFSKTNQWLVGMNSSENSDEQSSLIMIDSNKLNFNTKLKSTDILEYKLKEPVNIGEAFKEIRNEADKVEKEFGVRILVGNEVKNAEGNTGYIFVSNEENQDEFSFQNEMERVKILGKTLAMYPEGFFDYFKSANGQCGLRISLVKELKNDSYSSFTSAGIAFTTGDWYDIAVCSNEIYDKGETLHHEMWHSVENLIETKLGYFDNAGWSMLNPENFMYYYDFDEYSEKAGTDLNTPTFYNAKKNGETMYNLPYFISDYSMVTPMEDRATLIAQLFMWDYDVLEDRMYLTGDSELKKYPHLKAKLEYLEDYSKRLFGYVYWHKMLEKMDKTKAS